MQLIGACGGFRLIQDFIRISLFLTFHLQIVLFMLNLEKEIGNKILHLTKNVLCFLKFRKQFFPFFFETLSCFLVK